MYYCVYDLRLCVYRITCPTDDQRRCKGVMLCVHFMFTEALVLQMIAEDSLISYFVYTVFTESLVLDMIREDSLILCFVCKVYLQNHILKHQPPFKYPLQVKRAYTRNLTRILDMRDLIILCWKQCVYRITFRCNSRGSHAQYKCGSHARYKCADWWHKQR